MALVSASASNLTNPSFLKTRKKKMKAQSSFSRMKVPTFTAGNKKAKRFK